MHMNEAFRKFSQTMSHCAGSSWAFMLSLLIIASWASSGPYFRFSETWQLVVNTGTTIVTFLMVFLVQNTQNRDSQAIHLKLNELIRAVKEARTGMVDLEDLGDEELETLHEEFAKLRKKFRRDPDGQQVGAISDRAAEVTEDVGGRPALPLRSR
jgi:low affinity Fe/Cu permease